MATPKLTIEQQQINKMLKDRGYYTYKYADFNKDENAIELHKLFINKDTKWDANIKLDWFIFKKLRDKKLHNNPVNWDIEYDRLATKMLFGIDNEALLQKVTHTEYGVYCEQDTITGEYYFDDKLQSKVDSWIKYCHSIDRCLQQYSIDQAIWSKSAKNKREYKKYWKDFSQQPLILNDTNNIIHTYNKFLDDNYGLNQSTRAKAKFLLSLELPNISTYKIAKEIVETSELIY